MNSWNKLQMPESGSEPDLCFHMVLFSFPNYRDLYFLSTQVTFFTKCSGSGFFDSFVTTDISRSGFAEFGHSDKNCVFLASVDMSHWRVVI